MFQEIQDLLLNARSRFKLAAPTSLPARARLAALALATVASLACGTSGDTTASDGIVVRDSAGVEIVENSAEAVAALPQWTIDTAPVLRIAGDAADNTFSSIWLIVRRKDGRIIVYDNRNRDVRQFSPTGSLETIIARGGRGPGEIGSIEKMQLLHNDSLIVFDSNQSRATVQMLPRILPLRLPSTRLPLQKRWSSTPQLRRKVAKRGRTSAPCSLASAPS